MTEVSDIPRGRIVIETLPLASGNYGGILQAFALRRAVERLGFDAQVDTVARWPITWRTLPGQIRSALRLRSWDRVIGVPQLNVRIRRPARFVEEFIPTVQLLTSTGSVRRGINISDVDVFITGSDQVWRRAYGRLDRFMLGFVNSGQSGKVAYAASFGRADLSEFSDADRERAREWLADFDAISVREDSAVAILQGEWALESVHVLDPTMLIEPSVFADLAATAHDWSPPPRPYLLMLCLDPDDEARQAVASLAKKLDLELIDFYPPPIESRRDLAQSPETYMLPSPEAWLASIAGAAAVVTDSFHAFVFSTIFERQVLTIGNRGRGQARFDSLLRMLGLESRAVDDPADLSALQMQSSIDWEAVHSRKSRLRQDSISFLERSIEDALNRVNAPTLLKAEG